MSALDNPTIVMIVDHMTWMVNFGVLLPPLRQEFRPGWSIYRRSRWWIFYCSCLAYRKRNRWKGLHGRVYLFDKSQEWAVKTALLRFEFWPCFHIIKTAAW